MLLCAAPAPSWLLSGIPFCSRRNLTQCAFDLSAPGLKPVVQKRLPSSPPFLGCNQCKAGRSGLRLSAERTSPSEILLFRQLYKVKLCFGVYTPEWTKLTSLKTMAILKYPYEYLLRMERDLKLYMCNKNTNSYHVSVMNSENGQ